MADEPDAYERLKKLASASSQPTAAAAAVPSLRPSRVEGAVKFGGFKNYEREGIPYREPLERLQDWNEVQAKDDSPEHQKLLNTQSARYAKSWVTLRARWVTL